MFEDIDEVIEQLDQMLAYIETANYDDSYHLALEFAQQFRDELLANKDG